MNKLLSIIYNKLSTVHEIIAIISMAIIKSMIDGFVLTKLWGWFIVPVFNVPKMMAIPAIGIAMIFSFMLSSNIVSLRKRLDDGEDETEIIFQHVKKGALIALYFLISGWVVSWFM